MRQSLQISVEVSMYPLTENYIPPIDNFLSQLHLVEGLKVQTNNMSTQIFGPSDLVFTTVHNLVYDAYKGGNQYSFVMKVLNGDVSSQSIPDYKK